MDTLPDHLPSTSFKQFGASFCSFTKRMNDPTLSEGNIEGAKSAFAYAYLNLSGCSESERCAAAAALDLGLREYEAALRRVRKRAPL